MSRKKQVPNNALNSSFTKEVRLGKGSAENYDKYEPSWRFSFLDQEGPWGWNNIPPEERWDILANKINSQESINWASLKTSGSHNISVEKLSKAAKKRLSEIGYDDIDELFSLRISGKERIWGIRDRYALKILWWDPKHEVYPVQKKHT